MSKHRFGRSLGLLLALMLVLSALPVTALAAEAENTAFTLIELVATDVTLDETVFTHTGSEIRPNVTVRVRDRLLTLDQDYTLEYADNIAPGTAKVIVTGIATASEDLGYTGTVEVPFYINEKAPEEPGTPSFTLIELKDADVSLEGTEFVYSGQPIQPQVTVTVDGKTLTAGKDYALEYTDNLVPGTGTVIVRGIATASETLGYTGEVRKSFTIRPMTEQEYPLTEIKAEHVTIRGKEFTYTGSPIEPEITVTVDGKTLTAGKDYTLSYANNVEVGSGTATITGLATATEFGGYTGTVAVKFTIRPVTEETDPLVEIKAEHVKLEKENFYYTGKEIQPKLTVTMDGKTLTAGTDYSVTYESNVSPGTATVTVSGIATGGYTGKVTKTFTIVPNYQITQGSGAKWYLGSSRDLSFAFSGSAKDLTVVSVNGKALADSDYAVTGNTLTLKSSFLNTQKLGSHTLTLHFADGEAVGSFQVVEGLDTTNPQTGDTFPLHTLTAVMFISLTGLAGMGYAWYKKLWK